MAMRKDPTDQRKDVQEIIYRAYHAIDALEQYNNALHKLEEHFLSESEVRVITYGDVRDTIGRLLQTKDCLENVMRQYEKYLEFDASTLDCLVRQTKAEV